MIPGFKPLLASPADLDKLDLTDMLLSPKLDGIRAIVIDGVVMSRSLKPIPNRHVQKLFAHLDYYDGELICGDPTSPTCYRDTNSAVMSRSGEPDVAFHVFDHIQYPGHEYSNRVWRLEESESVEVVAQHPLTEEFNLEFWEAYYLEKGFEGVMLRKEGGQNSLYKFGRATAKSQTLLKVKRMSSDEARILEVVELEHNMNEATTNALGHTERSAHKENKVGGGTMGAIRVRCLSTGVEFSIGTGFTAADRAQFWRDRDALRGQIVTYNHFMVGRKDLPRFPSFKGLRNQIDL